MSVLDYKSAYLHLFNGISDVIEQMIKLQQDAEEICVSQKSDEKILIYPFDEK